MDERERFTTQLITAWIAQLRNVSPEGEDELLQGGRLAEPSGPQQLPDSGGYSDKSEPDVRQAYPTEAKARDKARLKAQRDRGNAHAVEKRNMKVEEHYDITTTIVLRT